jgi:two-component system chemotaxis response regulator CheB
MGGAAVVQDPADAEYPQMPAAALNYVPADYVAKVADIGLILDTLARPVPDADKKKGEGRTT